MDIDRFSLSSLWTVHSFFLLIISAETGKRKSFKITSLIMLIEKRAVAIASLGSVIILRNSDILGVSCTGEGEGKHTKSKRK